MSPSCSDADAWPFALMVIATVLGPTAIIVASIAARAHRARTLLWAHSPPRSVDPAGLPQGDR